MNPTSQPPIRAFLFDLDGTLVDNMRLHYVVWSEYLTAHDVRVDPDAFRRRTAGMTNPEILRLAFGEQITAEEIDAHAAAKEVRYREMALAVFRPMAGLVDLLTQARAGGTLLALATAAPRENVDFSLDILGVGEFFHAQVCADDLTRGKPDPQTFLLAAERLGVPAEECLVFEDSDAGMQAAANAGMPVIALTTGMTAEQAMAYPHVRMAVPDYTTIDYSAILRFSNHTERPGRA